MKINKSTVGAVKMFAGLALLGLASFPAYATDTSVLWTGAGLTGTLGATSVTLTTGAGGGAVNNTGNWNTEAATDNGGAISYSNPSSATNLGTVGTGQTAQSVTFGAPVINPILLIDFPFTTTSIVLTGLSPTVVSSNNCMLTTVTVTCPGSTRNASNGIAVQLNGTFTTISFTYGDSAGTATVGFSLALAPIVPPTISKAFSPTSIGTGATSVVTLTLSNSNSTALTGGAFTDTLSNMSAVGGAVGGTCVGTTPGTLTASATALSFTGITIPASSNCTVTFSVTSSVVGANTNTTSGVTTTQTPTAGTVSNTATLTVFATPTFTKAFSPTQIDQLQTSTLTFTLSNSNTGSLTGAAFTDTLPTGLIVAAANGLTITCVGGTATATPGSNSVSLSGGTIPGSSSCIVTVVVKATGSGSLVNTTSTLTTNEADPGAAATATLVVIPISDFPFQVRYSANLNIGESYIDIGNDGANGAPLLGPGFGAASGNLCVNVYAFDPNEELVSCCSCLVTPDQTVHLGVNADLTSKTLTGVVPTSVTVKLVATLAGTGGSGTGTVCNNSAASIAGIGSAVTGMSAYGTTLHPTPTMGAYATTETPFTAATLSATELSSIVGRCAAIIGNASGFGICTSCHNGALGGQKL